MTEPPYGIICNLLKKGEVIPFLGAGVSLSSRRLDAKWEENSGETGHMTRIEQIG